MLKSGLTGSRKWPKCQFLLEVFLQELEKECESSGLIDPADEQLQQCRFMLSMGGFRLVLSSELTSKNAAVVKQEIWQECEIKYKELPPTQL